jgi:hypothetical protein
MLPRHLQQIRYPGENPLSSLKRLIPPHLLLEKHQYVSLRPFQDASLQSVSRLSIFKPERRLVTVTLIGLHDALKGLNAQYKNAYPSLTAAFDADAQVVIAQGRFFTRAR